MDQTTTVERRGTPTKQQIDSVNEARAVEIIGFYRGLVLDTVETHFGRTSAWSLVRSTLLKVLGDRGMEQKIRALVRAMEGTDGATSTGS